MRQQDYFPLVEKIRCRISTWTSRFLSYDGRLQLIKAVIMSLVNFWASVYLLPSKCIRDIERICGAFLWSGPELKSTGAKVAWSTVCWEKEEGGLGIRDLKVVNRVNVLKIIWRLLTGSSLWGKWIRSNLLKQKNFWEIKEDTRMGSWMWRKMIKMREVARSFHKKTWGMEEILLSGLIIGLRRKF
uniref:Reverse transcriptase zinc-binding domain-containing protein n=1 Tax=Brassica oleracea var. oleracea TaxID=109376 RepID=A0A0D3D1G8_BRAOL